MHDDDKHDDRDPLDGDDIDAAFAALVEGTYRAGFAPKRQQEVFRKKKDRPGGGFFFMPEPFAVYQIKSGQEFDLCRKRLSYLIRRYVTESSAPGRR